MKISNLTFLNNHCSNDPKLVGEMLGLLIKHTPAHIDKLRYHIGISNWKYVREAAHDLKPSITIMGMGKDYETMGATIMEHAEKQEKLDEVQCLFTKLETGCGQAMKELNEELDMINKGGAKPPGFSAKAILLMASLLASFK